MSNQKRSHIIPSPPLPGIDSSPPSVLLPPLIETETTHTQAETEAECAPYFVNLSNLTSGQLDHLCQVGLLVVQNDDDDDDDDDDNNNNNNRGRQRRYNYTSASIQLLRDKHCKYLEQVWHKPLKAPFVSLDSSRPWILYWCLHGYDLLTTTSTTTSTTTETDKKIRMEPKPSRRSRLTNQQGCNMVKTLQECWQSYHTRTPPVALMTSTTTTNTNNRTSKDDAIDHHNDDDDVGVVDHDRDTFNNKIMRDPLYFTRHSRDVLFDHDDDDGTTTTTTAIAEYYCGGFGGGPGQMAHAATTYAAILTLCILATDDDEDGGIDGGEEDSKEEDGPNNGDIDDKDDGEDDDDDDEEDEDEDEYAVHYSVRAYQFLKDIRIPLYRWMASLQQQAEMGDSHAGGYRMHHDGEVDVRATYTIVACAKLLQLLPPGSFLTRQAVSDFCVSCQTYEGGMGGVPFSEAHGGYTFCALAALYIMGGLELTGAPTNNASVDLPALVAWLARRQMSFEGGFSGRANKLVDGCYSFWQGGAMAIASRAVATMSTIDDDNDDTTGGDDPWLRQWSNHSGAAKSDVDHGLPFPLLFEVTMLERYILLCAQEVHGGLRDKPSKPRDFYHTCYNLSGLSVAQNCSRVVTTTATTVVEQGEVEGDVVGITDEGYGDPQQTLLAPTHPCYNIRVDRVQKMLSKTWLV